MGGKYTLKHTNGSFTRTCALSFFAVDVKIDRNSIRFGSFYLDNKWTRNAARRGTLSSKFSISCPKLSVESGTLPCDTLMHPSSSQTYLRCMDFTFRMTSVVGFKLVCT